MKRIATILSALLLAGTLFAQTTGQEFLEKYTRQVSRLGLDGVGVATILDKWEAAFPEDPLMMEARYAYSYNKSRSYEVVRKDAAKFLGQKPILSIPDSTGVPVNYFQVTRFDEEIFAGALGWIDKAIKQKPREITFFCDKLTGLFEYEGEVPDQTLQTINYLIEMHASDTTFWMSGNNQVSVEEFCALVQEYCFNYYKLGNSGGHEAFKSVSEKMLKIYPKKTDFLTNVGSYYLVYKNDFKKAEKYYKKALKINPDDPAANANMRILAKKKASKK